MVRISAKLTLEIFCRVCARTLEERLRVRIGKLVAATWHGVGGSGRNPVCSFDGGHSPWRMIMEKQKPLSVNIAKTASLTSQVMPRFIVTESVLKKTKTVIICK